MKRESVFSEYTSAICSLKVLAAFIIIITFIFGCGKGDNQSSEINTVQNAVSHEGVSAESAGYMDIAAWEKAKTELKTIDEIIKTFNGFYNIWGWAYEHLTFYRFKEALETAEYLPGKLDEIEKLAESIKPVNEYPGIVSIKQCYINMIALHRDGSQSLKMSIIAVRDKNPSAEKTHVDAYTAKWKEAMEYSKKSFAIMQEILTRGGRTEYQKMAGVQKSTAESAALCRAIIRKNVSVYDGTILKQTAEIQALAGKSQWDGVLVKTDYIYSLIQKSIMETGQADPGNRKDLWDARQELVTALSQQMMAVKKMQEYSENRKSGNVKDAEQAYRVYEILRKSAAEARSKLKKAAF